MTNDPKHKDVKAILFLYSLESFLYVRLNQISREFNESAVTTLGPYSVALKRVIDTVQSKREDNTAGPFYCYRGLALTQQQISSWSKRKKIFLDGYNSASMD